LANGEIAINTYDGKLFYRGGVSNTIQTIERFQGPAGLNQEIQFNDSGVLGANSGLSFNKSSGIFSTKQISVTNSTGDEGGEILLAKPSTNTTLVGTGITIDAFQNKIRFFEQGGSARGAYIDLTECVGGAGTNLLNPTSTPDTTARNTANAAFIQANAAFTAANSAGVYANGAFAAANAATATDLTQNNSITAAFTAANSAGVYANGAFTQANSNYTSAVTKLDVTNSGSSAFLIDQYAGNNPSIYVGAGETLSFNLNVTGHPFVIRVSSGGSNYDTGLTHVSTAGVVTTGSAAQGQVTGVLYWKVPFSLVGSTYVYQCTIHGGMVGNIVIQQPASFVAANTTLAFNTANAAFLAANAATATDTTQNNSITAAFAAANAATATNLTQNNSITAAFAAANAATATDTTQNNSIAAAFTRANNSLNANTGGTITGDLTIGTGAGGIIAGANVIYSNVFVANSNGYIQFSDGSRQFTANAGSGGGTTDTFARNQANSAFIQANAAFNVANTGGGVANSFGQIVANVGTILATSSNDSFQIIGESGISVSSNVSAKKVIVSVPAGFTFTTADYGFVTDTTNVIYDYGTL
jgi:hypothetical protein